MLYLPTLYLTQMAPMDVHIETHDAKGGFGTPRGRTILTRYTAFITPKTLLIMVLPQGVPKLPLAPCVSHCTSLYSI